MRARQHNELLNGVSGHPCLVTKVNCMLKDRLWRIERGERQVVMVAGAEHNVRAVNTNRLLWPGISHKRVLDFASSICYRVELLPTWAENASRTFWQFRNLTISSHEKDHYPRSPRGIRNAVRRHRQTRCGRTGDVVLVWFEP